MGTSSFNGVTPILVALVWMIGTWGSAAAQNDFDADRQAGEEATFGGVEFVWCPPGSFLMGSPRTEQDEFPLRRTTISTGFWLSKFEVTKAQWTEVMGTAPWEGFSRVTNDPDTPAVYVSWTDAQAFMDALNGEEGKGYRLPTEAEWEYACEAAADGSYGFGDGSDVLPEYAWFDQNTLEAGRISAQPVGSKQPNAWGLYDMHGNVLEWCFDWFAAYSRQPAIDPSGPEQGSTRIARGGSWLNDAYNLRCANRSRFPPATRGAFLGFRLVKDPIVNSTQPDER